MLLDADGMMVSIRDSEMMRSVLFVSYVGRFSGCGSCFFSGVEDAREVWKEKAPVYEWEDGPLTLTANYIFTEMPWKL